MKNLRLAAFLLFAVCVFCLPAQAQNKWTYKADNGATRESDRVKITVVITQRPNGYEVSGEYTYLGDTCKLRGSYFPAGQRLRATCVFDDGEKSKVTGSKLAGKDAFQVSVGWGELVAWRDGIKPKSNGSSTESSSSAIALLESGDYEVDAAGWPSTWTLTISGASVSGSSTWECCPGHRVDPLSGSIVGQKIELTRTCQSQGYDQPCVQVYSGTISGNGASGKATMNGNPLGSWSMTLKSKKR